MNKSIKEIVFVGAGHVGVPTAAVFANKCSHVRIEVIDCSVERIAALNSNDLPFYEPGLHDLVQSCRNKNLFFLHESESSMKSADIIFICVNTPIFIDENFKHTLDISNIKNVAHKIRECCASNNNNTIIVEKSTVPIHSAKCLHDILNSDNNSKREDEKKNKKKYAILSNPEFLAEGKAIENLSQPDRVLIGGCGESDDIDSAIECLSDLYKHWVASDRIIIMSSSSAELSKLVANAMLAQRVSSINCVSSLCEKIGCNVNEVALAVGTDRRIGCDFLRPSIGFGGSCFQKDIQCLIYFCELHGLPEAAEYWKGILKINEYQKERFTNLVVKEIELINTKKPCRIALFGFAFKSQTSDCSNSASISICEGLLKNNYHLAIYDKLVTDMTIHSCLSKENGVKQSGGYEICHDPLQAINSAQAIVFCLDCDEYLNLDFHQIFKNMAGNPIIFDGRNFLNHNDLENIGYIVKAIGRP
jgi:UDPglucose 6-dehydrogenase